MKKSIIITTVLILMLALIFSLSACKDPKIEIDAPTTYQIATAQDFIKLNDKLGVKYSKATFEIVNDLDFAGITDFRPIGSSIDNAFHGSVDGKGHKLFNINVAKYNSANVGLFGVVNSATIKNLNLDNVTFNGRLFEKYNNIGALIGLSVGSTKIENITASSDMQIKMTVEIDNFDEVKSGDQNYHLRVNNQIGYVGGIVGYSSGNIIIDNAKFQGNVKFHQQNKYYYFGNMGKEYTYDPFNDPSNPNYEETLMGDSIKIKDAFVGGIIGYAGGLNNMIKNCTVLDFKTDIITKNLLIGGIVGSVNNAEVSNCSSTMTESIINTSDRSYVGGLCGQISATKLLSSTSFIDDMKIEKSASESVKFASINFGGAVGVAEKESEIKNVKAKSNLSLQDGNYVGGVVGILRNSKLTLCEAEGGERDFTIEYGENMYVMSIMPSTVYIYGGLVGKAFGGAFVSDSKTSFRAVQGAVGEVSSDIVVDENGKEISRAIPDIRGATLILTNSSNILSLEYAGQENRFKSNNIGTILNN